MATRPVAPNPVDESVVFPTFSTAHRSYPPTRDGIGAPAVAIDRPVFLVLQTWAAGDVVQYPPNK